MKDKKVVFFKTYLGGPKEKIRNLFFEKEKKF
jgi:hypothetical protein